MTDTEKTLEDYEDEAFQKQMYQYLKTKHDADPESLSEMEGGLLLLCIANRHLHLQERKRKYIEYYRGQYEKAKALVEQLENGTYPGTFLEFDDAYMTLMPAVTDQYVRNLGEIDLLIAMNDLSARYFKLKDKYFPLRPKTTFSPKEITCINEEHAALIAAGYPVDKIEAEAQKRGTFKAAFGADNLPPIRL